MRCLISGVFCLFILASVCQAQEQDVGLQPGWTVETRVEIVGTDTYSNSGEEASCSLVVQSNVGLARKGDFLVAHGKTPLTLEHVQPAMLPEGVEVLTSEFDSGGTFAAYSDATEARAEECGNRISTWYQAFGDRAGGVNIENTVGLGEASVQVYYRYGEDDAPQWFGYCFPTDIGENLSLLTPGPDIMNLSFAVEATERDPWNRNDPVPSEGVQFRVLYFTSLSFTEYVCFYASPWFETGEDGKATIDAGAGGALIETIRPAPAAPKDIYVTADGLAAGFGLNGGILPDMRTFQGTLVVRAVDPKGRPLQSVDVQVEGAVSQNAMTDAAGQASFEINGGGAGSESLDIALPPRFSASGSITQTIDDVQTNQVHDQSPAWYVAEFKIVENAKTYKDSGEAFEDFVLRLYKDDEVVTEVEGLKAKCESALQGEERACVGVNAWRWPVSADDTEQAFRHEIVWENDQGDEVALNGPIASTTIRQERVSALERPFRVHFVGLETPGVVTLKGRGVMTTWASSAKTAALQDWFRNVYPAPVTFTFGPDIRSSDPWFTFGSFRVLSYFLDMERHRATLPARPDLIVGVTGPGVLSADGLSEPRFRNVVMLDGSALRPHYLMHEYLHALGELDDYSYEQSVAPYAASADGFDSANMRRVYNAPESTNPPFKTIMYDRAKQPWMTRDAYETLLNEATVVMDYSIARALEEPKPKPAAPQEVMYVGGAFAGRQRWSTFSYSMHEVWPVFVDVAESWAPDETPTAIDWALGVTLSNGAQARTLEYGAWRGEPYDMDEGALAGAPLFRIPWDPDVESMSFTVKHFDGTEEVLQTVAFSPNAPTLTIDAPSAGATLSGRAAIVFTAADVDAGETLFAWIKTSADGGATWAPVAPWYEIPRGTNTFEMPCDAMDSADDLRVRVLVSDGTRSTRAEAGPFALEGRVAEPAAEVAPSRYDLTLPANAPFVLPVRIMNAGGADLTATLSAPSLGERLAVGLAEPDRTIPAGGVAEFLLRSVGATTETLQADVVFTTNDPARPALTVPVAIAFSEAACAPVIVSLQTDPPTANDFLALSTPMQFFIREAAGRSGLTGSATIRDAETGEELARIATASAGSDGRYVAEWTPPPECFGRPLAVEAALTDPATGLVSAGGATPLGWDAEFRLLRPNTPPRITAPIDGQSHAITFPQTLEIPFDAVDDEGDAISWSVRCTDDLDVRLDTAAKTLFVTFLLGKYGAESQVRLVASDERGAAAGATIPVGVYWPSESYAYLIGQESVLLQANPVRLRVGSTSSARPQSVVVACRALGAADWTDLGTQSFTMWDADAECWALDYDWNWPAGAARLELSLTLVDDQGAADPTPSVYLFDAPSAGGRIAWIETPPAVVAGSVFTMRMHVANESSERWTRAAGYRLRAIDGVDALTGLSELSFSALQDVERGAEAVLEYEVVAPATPGAYRTAWGIEREGLGIFGYGSETTVQVVQSAATAAEVQAVVDVLLGRASLEGTLAGWFDANGDGRLDAADVARFLSGERR